MNIERRPDSIGKDSIGDRKKWWWGRFLEKVAIANLKMDRPGSGCKR